MKKVALLILDGWGHGDHSKSDGIFHAKTPFMDSLEQNVANAELLTHGEHVGLPAGQMGNSEVGHLNIGAGRIVYQELSRINKSIADGEFEKNETLLKAFALARQNNKPVHLMGLVSDGGVHASAEHLYALCDFAKAQNIPEVFIHAFTDGRDCNPTTGAGHIATLEQHLAKSIGNIASISGRYYAMDRDNRWERVKLAYDAMVKGEGVFATSAKEAIANSYAEGVTDEFIRPVVLTENNQPIKTIEEGDIVICFNFRTDRCREISMALTQKSFPDYKMQPLKLHYVTMTNYDKSFKDVQIVFEKANLKNTLGEVVAKNGLNQIRIAETEKYPHVSFFFSGGQENEFDGEKRILIPSPSVATYDLKPQMSALEIRDAVCEEMKSNQPEFICLNFANTDMVGHTGVYEAILTAAETVDSCVEEVVKMGQSLGYAFIIIADHGNSDFAINSDGSPNTAHSKNPVPVIVLDTDVKELNDGTLRDVAPTIIELMGLDQPREMTGSSLILK